MNTNLDEHVGAYERKSIYDFDNLLQLEWYSQRILTLHPEAKSILELGLGYGVTTDKFSTQFSRHVVVDGARAVIDNFRKHYPNCNTEIQECIFEEFTTEEKFDLVVLGFVLEHVDNPVAVMRKFKQFLSVSGRMFITVPNAAALNRRLGHLAGLLPDICEMSEHDKLLGHKRYYTVETLRRDIEAAELKIHRFEGIYLKPLTTSQMKSLNLPDSIIQALCAMAIDYPELSSSLFAEVALKIHDR
jgi:2-polyprenyl-3-methyl-5-hydroxy-6-metoxy-1,4-benzoquinol methylase